MDHESSSGFRNSIDTRHGSAIGLTAFYAINNYLKGSVSKWIWHGVNEQLLAWRVLKMDFDEKAQMKKL